MRIFVSFDYVLVLGFAMFQNFFVSLYTLYLFFNDTAARFFFLGQLVEGRKSKVGIEYSKQKNDDVACMEAIRRL